MAQAVKKIKPEDIVQTQLELIHSSPVNPFWQSSLFNEVYLQNDVPVKYKEMWTAVEAGPFYEFCNGFRNLCEELKDADLSSWSERNTINRLIKPVLRMLGYFDKCSPNQEPWAEDEAFSVKEGGELKTYKPDFIIVNDPKELKYIERKNGEDKLEEARSTVILPIEAKYWDRIEDLRRRSGEDSKRADKKDQSDATRSLDFDEQCMKYMEILNKDYGILTDGKTWRLYNKELSSDSYRRNYQFNLGHLIKHVNAGLDKDQRDYDVFIESAKYFFHFFSKQALYSEAGERRFVDDLLEYSKKYVTKVEEDLKARFVKAMTHACNGFLRSVSGSKDKANLSAIRNVAESQLFNILFIKHCESRNILPLKQSPEYRKISLSNTIDKLEYFNPEREEDNLNLPVLKRMFSKDFKYDPKGSELYERLLKLTKIVQDGTKIDFGGFEIKGFKESIFSKEEWAFVQTHHLSNSEILSILFELGYCESDISGKKYQQIPYNFFSPRQLGSIYESFLEFRLEKAEADSAFIKGEWQHANLNSDKIKNLDVPKVKAGQLYFAPDNVDRKATGSFYTPDFVVQDIARRALDPVCANLDSAGILKLRICDPAMGSGHFLGAALNYLAKRYLEKVESEINDDLQIALVEAKQKILHNCIFGVDINSRAVKLAKMSLWLDSATPGRILEHLDDQLKVGDSLGLTSEFDWAASFDLGKNNTNGFNVVIGNPPWGANIDHLRDKIEDRFAAVAKNHKEIYKLFVQAGVEILRDGGVLGYILPAGVLYQPRSKDARSYVLEHSTLITVINLGDGVFGKDVVCPSAVIITAKGERDAYDFEFYDQSRVSDLTEKELHLRSDRAVAVSVSDIKSSSDIEFSPSRDLIFSEDEFLPLEQVIELKDSGINYQRVGVGLAAKGKSDLSDRLLYEGRKESPKDIMYWKGEDINEFWIADKTERMVRHNFADIPRKGEVVRIAVEVFKTAPKLLWRQTASQPIAVVDEKGVAFGRSIQCGFLQNGFSKEWYYLLAILMNSNFIREQYKAKVMEEGRVFPQIKLAKLRNLLVPRANANELREAKELYKKCCSGLDEKTKDAVEKFVSKMIARRSNSKKKAA